MANVVEIQIVVDNAQAVSAIGQTAAGLKGLSSTTQVASSQWSGFAAGTASSTRGLAYFGEEAKKTSGHMATALDGVRLMSQEFGLRLPRALEAILSRMPAVTAAIGGLMGAFAGIAVAEVLYHAGEAVYNLYNKYISLNAAADDYSKIVQQHKDEDFVNPHSIETATDRILEAYKAAKAFKALGQEIHDGAWKDILGGLGNPAQFSQGIGGLIIGRKTTDLGYKVQMQSDAMDPKALGMQHELTMMQIESAHAADGELRGQAKINAELQKRIDLNRENRRYTQGQDSIVQGIGNRHGGEQKQNIEDQTARAEAAAQEVELRRQVKEKTISLQNEATNARLQGGALYLAQELQAEDAIRRTGIGTQEQIDAVRLRYHNDQMKRIEDENEAVAKRARSEQEAGLPGIAKIQAQGQDRIGDINERQSKGLYSDQTAPGQASAQADKDRATSAAQTYREMTEAEKQFEEQQQAGIERNNSAMLSGFAKIESELQSSLQKRADEYTKIYGDMEQQDAVHAAARASLQAANDSDSANAARERAQLEQQLADQTLQKDREASEAERKVRGDGLLSWASQYRSAVADIEAQHAAMLAKIDTEQKKPGVTDAANAQLEQQKVDADRIANAQIDEANQQLAHSIAGTLESAFDSPIKTIQNKMKSMMFQILADWLAQTGAFKGVFGNQASAAIGGNAQGTSHTGGLAGFGNIFAGHGAGGGGAASFSTSPIGALAHTIGLGHPASAVSGTNEVTPGSAGARPFGSTTGTPSISPVGLGHLASAVSGTNDVAPGSSGSRPFGSATSTASSGISGIGMASDFGSLAQTGLNAAQAFGNLDSTNSGVTGGIRQVDNGPKAEPTFEANSTSVLSPTGGVSGAASAAGGLVSAGVGAYTGFQGVLNSFESGQGSGILTGATSGAELGGSIGMLAGPEGAAIGAGVGAAVGATAGLVGWATGEGNSLGAAGYFKTTIRPQLQAIEGAYASGSGGSAVSAIAAINEAANQGYTAIFDKFGGTAASSIRSQYIDVDTKALDDEINQMAKGGHDYGNASAVQFHTGGTITGFGDLATSSNEGFIHAMLSESVVNPSASSTHAPYINAMNSGASESDVASMYLRNGAASGSGSGDTHIHQYGDAHDGAEPSIYPAVHPRPALLPRVGVCAGHQNAVDVWALQSERRDRGNLSRCYRSDPSRGGYVRPRRRRVGQCLYVRASIG